MPENAIKNGGLKLKKNYYETTAPGAESEPAGSAPPTPFHRKHDTSERLWQNIHIAVAWLLFLILGGGLVYFRFISNLPWLTPNLYKQYGMMAVGIIYIVSIFFALKDNMFDGLLAIIVPFYPFYYLFTGCSSLFFRAIAAALLAAFGYDCLLMVQSLSLKVFDKASCWIEHV